VTGVTDVVIAYIRHHGDPHVFPAAVANLQPFWGISVAVVR
jgi:hypothetical protein